MKFFIKKIVFTLVVFFVAGCGGGGGGGGDGGAIGSANQGDSIPASGTSSVNLFVSSASLNSRSIDATKPVVSTMIEGEQPSSFSINATLKGDLSILRQRNELYLKIEDTGGVYDRPDKPISSSNVSFGSSIDFQYSGDVRLFVVGTRTYLKAGDYKGELILIICLDSNCNERVGGAPIRLLYETKVVPGLELSEESFFVATKFGDPSVREVKTIATVALDSLTPAPEAIFSAAVPGIGIVKISERKYSISIKIEPAAPGVRDISIPFTVKGDGFPLLPNNPTYKKTIKIKHTVEDNPSVDVVFYPAEANISAEKFRSNGVAIQYNYVTRPGVIFEYPVAEYLSAPIAAANNILVNQWIVVDGGLGVSVCRSGFNATCLPEGNYVGRIRWSYYFNGIKKNFYYPVFLNIF